MAKFQIIEAPGGNSDAGTKVGEGETITEIRQTLRTINPGYARVLFVRYGDGRDLSREDRLALAGIGDN